MKTLKINSMKIVLNLSFAILLLTTACAQPDKKSNSDVTSNTEVVKTKPDMNINMAVLSGNLEVVKQHIEAGTNINEKDAMSGSTPLITAASFNKLEIVKVLIDANADLSLKNSDGSTALHSAAFFGRIKIVQILIDAKADKTIRNNFGATPSETVMGPFAEVKPIYDMIKQQLEPFGFVLDMNELEKARPVVAQLLE